MKKYIILTPSITNMGGSEMFTYNKYKYLSSHGWDVNVFYFNQSGDILLRELERFKDNCIPDLIYSISYFSRKGQEKILNRLSDGVTQADEVVVESHLYSLSLWGELLAKKIKAKSIMNCMEENIGQISEEEVNFVEYKMRRYEILNATPKSMHRYYGKYYQDSYLDYTHTYMRALCSNVVTHSIDYNLTVPDSDYNILSIGRLDKPYVIPTFMEVSKFVQQHPEKRFNLLFIGGDPKGDADSRIKGLFSNANNVTLLFLGYMFPVPANIIDINDVSIASSNSVLVSNNEGIPTIVIETQDYLPIGIYGRTTENKFSRDNEPPVSVVELLEDILIYGKYPKKEPLENNEAVEIDEVFGKQVEFLSLSPSDGAAYPVSRLYPWKKKLVDRGKRVLHNIGL